DGLEVLHAEAVVELEAECSRLHADARIERLALDRLEDVAVLLRDRPRLGGARDLLAEHVDRRQLALRVQRRDDVAGILEGRPRDVARRQPVDERLGYRRQHPDDRAIEDHGRGIVVSGRWTSAESTIRSPSWTPPGLCCSRTRPATT